jgi:uncharacterized membrane protein YciS (DUF1049 family)
MPAVKLITYFLLAIFIGSFAVQNMTSVEINYYDFHLNLHTLELPLVTVVIIPLGLGLLGAWLMWLASWLKMRMVIIKQNKTISSMEKELDKLKNTPQLPAQVESSTDS